MKRALFLVLFALVMAACAGPSALRGRIEGLAAIADNAEKSGAIKCAPRELALARSHLEFAKNELDQGQYSNAVKHVDLAEPNAHAALANSPPERCAARGFITPRVGDKDGDGIPDNVDKCPNDPETVNGVDDDDGCPDTRVSTGPVEASDRINLQGQRIDFVAGSDKLTGASKTILNQVATLIKNNKDTVRIEVHVALSTRSKNAAQIAAAKKKDKTLSQARAAAIQAYLFGQGVPQPAITGAVGLGSDRPFGNNPPDDPINERVDFIKAQQRTP